MVDGKRTISGVTRDSSGSPLGNCHVYLYETGTMALAQDMTSDAGGNFSFVVPTSNLYFIIAFKPGSPDVAGVTDNNIVGV